jgi:hypothetical protein
VHPTRNTGAARPDGQRASAGRLCAQASVTAVAFFDFYHGQTGVATNAIELNPVLAFR